MSSKQSALPEVGTVWNIYRFRRALQGNLEKVFVRRAKVHRVISGGYRLSELETANYYGLHLVADFDTVKRLQQTERVRVIFLDDRADARFHPYFWDRKYPLHHEKFVQVALVKRKPQDDGKWVEIKNDSVSYTIPIASEGTGESLDDLGNDDIEPKPISQPDPLPKEFYQQSLGRVVRKSQLDNAKFNLDMELEHYVSAKVAAKLAELKRQEQSALFGEVARLSAELAALKSALSASFPTINIK